MSDSVALNNSPETFDNMTTAEFEDRLPDLIANVDGGTLTEDPRFTTFFEKNPTCAALVRDLEAIAKAAKDLFPSGEVEEESAEPIAPDDKIWSNIASKLKNATSALDEPNGVTE